MVLAKQASAQAIKTKDCPLIKREEKQKTAPIKREGKSY
jgi:hypothetical protein